MDCSKCLKTLELMLDKRSRSAVFCKSTPIAGDTPLEEGVMLVASGAHRDPRLRSLYAGYGASVAGSGMISFISSHFFFFIF